MCAVWVIPGIVLRVVSLVDFSPVSVCSLFFSGTVALSFETVSFAICGTRDAFCLLFNLPVATGFDLVSLVLWRLVAIAISVFVSFGVLISIDFFLFVPSMRKKTNSSEI